MKRVLIIATAALLALPVFGAETVKDKPAEPAAKPADSPLVAASKRANRSGRKSVVITNDDVRNSKGHITTTTQNRSINVADPLPTPEMVAAGKTAKAKVIEAEKSAKKEAEKKVAEVKAMRAAARAEAGEYGSDDADEPVPPPPPANP